MAETQKKPNSLPEKKRPLKEFIDDNDKLLTSVGVMGAIAAFFTTVKGGELIAFLSFALMLVLDIELVRLLFKRTEMSATLTAFQFLSQAFPSAIGIFLIQTYPNYFISYFAPIVISLASISTQRFFSRRIKNRKKAFLAPLVLMVVLLSVYFLVYMLVGPFFNFWQNSSPT